MWSFLIGACADVAPRDPAPASVAARAPGDSAHVRLATWNLEWLTDRGPDDAPRRSPSDVAAMAAHIDAVGADVFAFQEVDGLVAARGVFPEPVWQLEVADEDDVQRVGVASRTDRADLHVTRRPDLADLDVGGLRRGVDVEVRVGDHALRLLVVHLKAGCAWPDDRLVPAETEACARLASQIPALTSWVDARAKEGVPFVILGDFNRQLAFDEALFAAMSDGDPPDARLHLATAGLEVACRPGDAPRPAIDHVVLDLRAQGWSDRVGPIVHPFAGRALSDHCPISLDLQVPP